MTSRDFCSHSYPHSPRSDRESSKSPSNTTCRTTSLSPTASPPPPSSLPPRPPKEVATFDACALPKSIKDAPPEQHQAIRKRQNVESAARSRVRKKAAMKAVEQKMEAHRVKLEALERRMAQLVGDIVEVRQRTAAVVGAPLDGVAYGAMVPPQIPMVDPIPGASPFQTSRPTQPSPTLGLYAPPCRSRSVPRSSLTGLTNSDPGPATSRQNVDRAASGPISLDDIAL